MKEAWEFQFFLIPTNMDPETQPFLESSNPRLVAGSMLVGSY